MRVSVDEYVCEGEREWERTENVIFECVWYVCKCASLKYMCIFSVFFYTCGFFRYHIYSLNYL